MSTDVVVSAADSVERGDAARDVADWRQARLHYEQAVRANPSLAHIWIQLGHAAKECGDYGTAENAYRRALRMNIGDADGHLHFGHLLKITGRPTAAMAFYSYALALQPTFLDARREIEALWRRGDVPGTNQMPKLAPSDLARFQSRDSPIEGPDFLGIGMPKAGTGWLFDQLKCHPDFWVPPIKGTYYLDKLVTRASDAEEMLEVLKDPHLLKRRTASLRPLDQSDIRFLELLRSYSGEPRDLNRYAALFRFGTGRIVGEITPGYSRLGEPELEAIAARFPKLRVIILLRDPIERLWSHICMLHRERKFDPSVLEADSAFRSFLRDSKDVGEFSYASRIVEKWRSFAPGLIFRHFFFDDLVQDPVETRARIISYLGGDPEKPSGDAPVNRDRKSGDPRLPLSDRNKAIIVEHLSAELQRCSNMFGEVATKWKHRYLP